MWLRSRSAYAGLAAWSDDSGYVIDEHDLRFVLVAPDDLTRLAARNRPLGMTSGGFAHFLGGLTAALSRCGATDADVRLQGSAVYLFSGPHKELPQTRDEVFALMRERLHRIPQRFEVDDALARIDTLWPSGNPRPRRPFFDLLHQLQMDRIRSDIDVQVSSDGLTRRARLLAADRGVSLTTLQVENPFYRFLTNDTVDDIAGELLRWADDMSEILNRVVAVKVFPSCGPPDVRGAPGSVTSSHFQPKDWVVRSPSDQP